MLINIFISSSVDITLIRPKCTYRTPISDLRSYQGNSSSAAPPPLLPSAVFSEASCGEPGECVFPGYVSPGNYLSEVSALKKFYAPLPDKVIMRDICHY